MRNPEHEDREFAIRCGHPVSTLGLTFYPILMREYRKFLSCKDSLILRLKSLPVRFQFMDFMTDVFMFDVELAKSGKSSGLFFGLLNMTYLALRTNPTLEEIQRGILVKNGGDNPVLDSVVFKQNGKEIAISPVQFSAQIRPLIAQQNGLELPDESENIDLVRANEEKKRINQSGVKLNVDPDVLVSSVAYQSRVRESEIYESWTVREFERRREAIERDKNFMLYAQAQLSGMVEFKNGNPHPSWCFDVEDNSLGTVPLSSVGKKLNK